MKLVTLLSILFVGISGFAQGELPNGKQMAARARAVSEATSALHSLENQKELFNAVTALCDAVVLKGYTGALDVITATDYHTCQEDMYILLAKYSKAKPK